MNSIQQEHHNTKPGVIGFFCSCFFLARKAANLGIWVTGPERGEALTETISKLWKNIKKQALKVKEINNILQTLHKLPISALLLSLALVQETFFSLISPIFR